MVVGGGELKQRDLKEGMAHLWPISQSPPPAPNPPGAGSLEVLGKPSEWGDCGKGPGRTGDVRFTQYSDGMAGQGALGTVTACLLAGGKVQGREPLLSYVLEVWGWPRSGTLLFGPQLE